MNSSTTVRSDERVAEWAKGALRRLSQARLEPTPANYARAYAEESGQPLVLPGAANGQAKDSGRPEEGQAGTGPSGTDWAGLIERLARQLERGSKQWTPARRKDSLHRVLQGSRSDAARLLQRLQGLIGAWETDVAPETLEALAGENENGPQAGAAEPGQPAEAASPWPGAAQSLHSGLRAGLGGPDPRAAALASALADELGALSQTLAGCEEGPARTARLGDHLAALQGHCERAGSFLAHRQHLIDELGGLCRELAGGLAELAEDESWARGQCASLQARLGEDAGAGGPSVRGVRAAAELLAQTRQRQRQVQGERQAAQTAIKSLIQRIIGEAGTLDEEAGRYRASLDRHAQAISRADSLPSLAGVVQALLDDNQAVQAAMAASRQRMQQDRERASELQSRVQQLEGELRRLSDEVATDALTQVANRRGLMLAFERLASEQARAQHGADAATAAPVLAVGLLDIDNFKKLNDTLGHAAGDQALKSLAAAVRERLRPEDHLARFGGEEFVVLLPGTAVAEAQQALTRLQRSLSAGLFMHEGRDVLVTFSAGVTAWQPGEALDTALERADQALYEAKRTGKNRTCMA